jgi:hypothetical protein
MQILCPSRVGSRAFLGGFARAEKSKRKRRQ